MVGQLPSARGFMKRLAEAVAQRCSVKKMFLEFSQNLQESTCARVSFLIKLEALACKFIKKRDSSKTLAQSCVIFAKFLRTPFLKEYFRWLLLVL